MKKKLQYCGIIIFIEHMFIHLNYSYESAGNDDIDWGQTKERCFIDWYTYDFFKKNNNVPSYIYIDLGIESCFEPTVRRKKHQIKSL